jgi:hypothetical protein
MLGRTSLNLPRKSGSARLCTGIRLILIPLFVTHSLAKLLFVETIMGNWLRRFLKYNPKVLQIKVLAAQLAISLASSLHLNRFILEGDSQVVTLALQQPSIVQDWRITDIITNTLDSIPANASWSVRKVNRSANFGAHYVAHWAPARFSSSSIPTSSLSHQFLVLHVSNNDPSNNSALVFFY